MTGQHKFRRLVPHFTDETFGFFGLMITRPNYDGFHNLSCYQPPKTYAAIDGQYAINWKGWEYVASRNSDCRNYPCGNPSDIGLGIGRGPC
ncbi:hypothetical protein [Mycobacterium colombiense]|uniref:hypothetical protein n=1 Tax=Mycobacterium colombiense TaxID=339268 RepID=UPI0011E4CE77|nr:hypothetical protein [Mycobacterium colombiense]